MSKRVVVLVLTLACLIGACQLLLPERFAVNAPILNSLLGLGVDAPAEDAIRARIRVPEGLSPSLYAEGLGNARNLLFAPSGALLVSRPRSGDVIVLAPDGDGDGRSDATRPLISGLRRPYGLAFHGEWLYIAEGDAVGRVGFDAETTTTRGEFERLVTGIPSGGNHWSRNIHFGPDGWLYLSIGSSCNVCLEEDERRAAILRYRPDGSAEELFATGLRNAVDFDWQPGSGRLFATDNGRDLLGDDFPPCELDEVVEGGFYGWPFLNGDNVPDPDFGKHDDPRLALAIAPAHDFRAHNAPLGITFIRHPDAPAALRGAALVALHGSWNRRQKDGYKVVSLHWDESGRIEERDFMTGFLHDDDVIGRPAHVAEGPDAAIYVSDDYSGSIWRIAAGGAAAASATPHMPASIETKAAQPVAGASRRGAALYEQYDCASCHEAERAAPGVVVKPLQDIAARYSASELANLLETPPPPMPAFELGEPERLELAAYLRSRFD